MMDKLSESLVGEMNIMNLTGHKQVKWHMDKLDEIVSAKETFDNLVNKGYSAFGSKDTSDPKHLMKEFDPTMKQLVMVPRIVGG